MVADSATSALERFLEGHSDDLTVIGRSGRTWDVLVPSYWKETVAVSIALGDRSLRCDCFFMLAPEENAEQVYKTLLRRNERSHVWKFVASAEGDVGLLAELPAAAVTEEELELLFGTLVTLVDDTYVPYMKLGFATSLAEQVRKGGPGLDRPPPWVKEP
ncbi:MAG: YbjN domain-containing protein [Actinomycetota bacterium]